MNDVILLRPYFVEGHADVFRAVEYGLFGNICPAVLFADYRVRVREGICIFNTFFCLIDIFSRTERGKIFIYGNFLLKGKLGAVGYQIKILVAQLCNALFMKTPDDVFHVLFYLYGPFNHRHAYAFLYA